MQIASVSDSLKIWKFQQDSSSSVSSSNDALKSSVPLVNSTLQLQANYRHKVQNFYSLAWNHTNQVVAIGGREPKIHLIQSNTGLLLQSLHLSDSDFKSLKISALDFSHNSRYLITTVQTPIQLWDLKTRKITSIFVGHQHSVVSLLFHENGEHFFSADELGQIWIWNLKTQQIHHKFFDLTASIDRSTPDNNYLTCMRLSPYSSSLGNYLASGYIDGSVKIWDASIGGQNDHAIIRKQKLHAEKVTSVAFSPRNPNVFVSVGYDEQLQLLDIHSKPTEVNLSVDVNQRLTSVSFHENGINCAVGTVEGNILMYDLRNTRYPIVQVTAHNPNPINMLAFQVPVNANRISSKKGKLGTPDSKENIRGNEGQKEETKDQLSSAALLPKPTPTPSASENRHDNGLKPPILVTSLDLSDSQPNPHSRPVAKMNETAVTGNSGSASALSSMHSTLSQRVDSKIKSFEESMKSKIPESRSFTDEGIESAERPSVYPSPHQIQSTLHEIYPPPPTQSILKSSKSTTLSAVEEALNQSKEQVKPPVQPSLNKSKLEEDSAFNDPTKYTYEQREQELLQSLSQYERNQQNPRPQSSNKATPLPTAETLSSNIPNDTDIYNVQDDFSSLRQAIKPVTSKELEDALDMLRYDIHCEIQEVMKEQVRQFTIAREETSSLIQELAKQLHDLVELNKELREENNHLRKIY